MRQKTGSADVVRLYYRYWFMCEPRPEYLSKQMAKRMLPELPNEVWTLVLGNLERARDFGRLQLVSRLFNAAIANVCWTKIKGFGTEYCGGKIMMHLSKKDKLWLSMDNWLLLAAEMTRKAKKITDISFDLHYTSVDDSEEFEEHVKFLGRAMDILAASNDQKTRSFHLEGNLAQLSTAFSSLVTFLDAKKQTLQGISITPNDQTNYAHQTTPFPPDLLASFRGCSQLHSVELLCHPGPFNNALLESIISGKGKLENLGVFHWDVSVAVILDSGIQLRKFGCDNVLLKNYAEEMGRRGLKGTDEHPLRTVKKLLVEGGLLPFFSLLPNLERLQTIESSVSVPELKWLLGGFLNEHKNRCGGRKELTCEFEVVVGVESGQELANAFRAALSCQTTVKELRDGRTAVICFRRNAAVVCRMQEFHIDERHGRMVEVEEIESSYDEMEYSSDETESSSSSEGDW